AARSWFGLRKIGSGCTKLVKLAFVVRVVQINQVAHECAKLAKLVQ
ncbi:9684_t:CDS:1, partial [Acaulospora morrowiae]